MCQDRRIEKTKQNLANCLLLLLKEKPIKKITVTELCVQANINRSTFYKYYDNPIAMLEQIEHELFQNLKNYLEINSIHNLFDRILAVTRYLASNSAHVNILVVANGGHSSNLSKLLSDIYLYHIKHWQIHNLEMSETQIDYLFTFVIEGSRGIIMKWINGGFKESPDHIAHLTATLCQHVLQSNEK